MKWLVAALFWLAAVPAPAQLVGTVRDSATRAPIPGAVVVLLDSTGASLGRNITNDRGVYGIALHPAMRRIQVLRIGFRPRVLAIPKATGNNASLDVTLAAIPRLLEPVAVMDQPNCPRRADGPAALALWEQAKDGLLAAIVAREVNAAQVVRLYFDRRIDRVADTTDWMEVRIDSTSTPHPFVAARTAADFIERGFIDDSAGLRIFHAPDAETLLDPAFPRGYCFSIAREEASRPHQVGLGFAAARKRNGLVDIVGVVWVDTAARALTDIMYRYAGLDARFDRANAGGAVSFRTMPNGSVLIDRWHIRLLAALRGAKVGPAGTIGRGDDFEIHEKGGEIASARWPDGTTWIASLSNVAGRAWYGTEPARGARLRLIETSYETVADTDGRFEFTQLLPGPYAMGVRDSILAPLEMTLRTGATFTAVRDSTIRLTLAVPTAKDYVLAACEARGVRGIGPFSLVGQAVDASGALLRGARFSVFQVDKPDDPPIWYGLTTERGLFVLCSVDRGNDLNIVVDAGRSHGGGRYVPDRAIGTIRIEVRPP